MKVSTTISPTSSTSSSSSMMVINSPVITNDKLLQNQPLQQTLSPKIDSVGDSKVDDLEEICYRLSQLNNDLTKDYLAEPSTNTNLEELRNLLNNIKI